MRSALVLLVAASCAGSTADTPAPAPPPAPTPPSPGTPALEVESLGECHDDPVPHHGAVPHADEFRITGGSRSVRLELDNIDASCPDPISFRLVPVTSGHDVRIEIVHGSTSPTRPWRDAVVHIRGLPPGPRDIQISHSTQPDQARVLSAEVTP
jgi:hypothetical protein